MLEQNSLGQPIGPAVPNWSPPPRPRRVILEGRTCRLEPLDAARHAAELFEADALDVSGASWTYLGYGPFADFESYREWCAGASESEDPLFFAIVDGSNRSATGIAGFLRIDAANGVIEIGHLHFSPRLQRTAAATEALCLMMRHAFELGYRRLEWKCNALNAPSRRAALRLGLSFEGVFAQAAVVKGHNRDTAWYAAIDSEWPDLRAAFEAWLAPSNFDAEGRQLKALSALTAPLVRHRG